MERLKLFLLYFYFGVAPFYSFICLVDGWKHAHGFFGVIWLVITSSLKGLVWPIHIWFV